MPSSAETVKEKVVDEYGNIRSDEQGYMNGSDVFNFVITEIPKDIKLLLANSGNSIVDCDYCVFIKPITLSIDILPKSCILKQKKYRRQLKKYGNTSSVSVPLTIVDQLKGKMNGDKKLLLSAFGVGMTWASAIVPFHDLKISDIIEV